MTSAGLILLFMTLIPALAIIISKRWLVKLDKKYFFILLIFAIFCFLYFFIARYILDAIQFNEFKDSPNPYVRDVFFSKLLLLDLCPFMSFALPIITIFDKKRRFARLLAPVTIIGSIVTIFGQCIWESPSDLFQYIFVGTEFNRLYFMMHLLSLLLGLWILMVSKTFTWKSCLCCFGAIVIWFVYTISAMNIFNVNWNVTGLSANDWISYMGQYNKMYLFWELPFPWIVVFWYSVALLFNYLIILAIPNNFLQFKKFIMKTLSFKPKIK